MDASQSESHTDLTDLFWRSIEISMGCVVPKYVQYILRLRGYDNAASVGTLTSDDIKQIEEYFKAKLEKKDVFQAEERKKFFHPYHNDSDEFEILPGHVKLIEKIVTHIDAMTMLHGPEFFNPHSEETIRKPSKVVTVRGRSVRGQQTVSQALARSSFVESRNRTSRLIMGPAMTLTSVMPENIQNSSTVARSTSSTGESTDPQNSSDGTQTGMHQSITELCMDSVSIEPADPHDKNETTVNVQSDGSLEKFIIEERVHLIEVIKVWMEKNVSDFFNQYSKQLVPEIMDAVMEKPKREPENESNDDERVDGTDDLMVLVFKFNCPKCGKAIRSTQQSTKNGESSYFSVSNIERHWKGHKAETENLAEIEPKKPKKCNDKKIILRKPEPRKLRSKAIACNKKEVPCGDEEFQILTDEETDGPGDFKIVKRKIPSHVN